MKKFLSEFKDFATRGNAVDLAVGVVIGGSFGAIVNSLVADIITPLISLVTAGADFSHLSFKLKDGAEPLLLTYGNFIQATITFVITAFAIFAMIKALNKVNRKKAEEEPVVEEVVVSDEAVLLEKILKALENQDSK